MRRHIYLFTIVISFVFRNVALADEIDWDSIVGDFTYYCSKPQASVECSKIMPPKIVTKNCRVLQRQLQKCSVNPSIKCKNEIRFRENELLPILNWRIARDYTPLKEGAIVTFDSRNTLGQVSDTINQAGIAVNCAAINANRAASNLSSNIVKAVVPKDIKCVRVIASPNWPWAVGFMNAAKSSNKLAQMGVTDKNTCLAKRAQIADEAEKEYPGIGRSSVNYVGGCLCTQVY